MPTALDTIIAELERMRLGKNGSTSADFAKSLPSFTRLAAQKDAAPSGRGMLSSVYLFAELMATESLLFADAPIECPRFEDLFQCFWRD